MEDSILVLSNSSSNGDLSDSGSSYKSDTYIRQTAPHVRERAKSAKDLVQSQERLVEMLQSMRSDLGKIDREASRLREDIVKSRQMFEIVVRRQDPRDVLSDSEGYNISHAMPRITFSTPRPSFEHQHAYHLPSFQTDTSSRSPFLQVGIYRRQCSFGSSRQSHSGTESELESQDDWRSDISCTSGTSEGDSTESSTDSNSVFDSYVNRRQSYFFTKQVSTDQQEPSDDVVEV